MCRVSKPGERFILLCLRRFEGRSYSEVAAGPMRDLLPDSNASCPRGDALIGGEGSGFHYVRGKPATPMTGLLFRRFSFLNFFRLHGQRIAPQLRLTRKFLLGFGFTELALRPLVREKRAAGLLPA